MAGLTNLAFREELHAIEAAISGQGIATCSDVLVARELASGARVEVSKLTRCRVTAFISRICRYTLGWGRLKAFLNGLDQ